MIFLVLGYLNKFVLIRANYSVAQALWVAIAMLGLGSVAIRRTLFSRARLEDIAVLLGVSGLLTTLQNTTLILASFAALAVVMGFINTMITNDWMHVRNAGVIAIGILLYSYPSRTSWQRVVEGIERKRIVNESTAKGSIN